MGHCLITVLEVDCYEGNMNSGKFSSQITRLQAVSLVVRSLLLRCRKEMVNVYDNVFLLSLQDSAMKHAGVEGKVEESVLTLQLAKHA